MCSGKDKIAQRTERGAHITSWSRLQQALSRHQGAVEISWCKAHITSDNFHQFNLTPEISVGNAVADELAQKGAMTGSRWTRSHGLSNSASTPLVYLLLRLLHEVSLLTLRMFCLQHDASGNVNAPSWRNPHRTHWSRLAKGIITVCVNILPQGVELWIGFGIPSAQDRPALVLPILCASAIRCFMSRTGSGFTETSAGAPHAGKLLSMRRGGRGEIASYWLGQRMPWLPDTCRSRRACAHRKGALSKSVSRLAADARFGLSQQGQHT